MPGFPQETVSLHYKSIDFILSPILRAVENTRHAFLSHHLTTERSILLWVPSEFSSVFFFWCKYNTKEYICTDVRACITNLYKVNKHSAGNRQVASPIMRFSFWYEFSRTFYRIPHSSATFDCEKINGVNPVFACCRTILTNEHTPPPPHYSV